MLACGCKRFSEGICGDLRLPGIPLMCFLMSVREKDADLSLTSGQFVLKGHCQSISRWVCVSCTIA